MRIKNVTYRKAVLISTRQYENQRIEVELTGRVEEDDDFMMCMDALQEIVNDRLLDELMVIKGFAPDNRKAAIKQVKTEFDRSRNALRKEFKL